MITLNYVFFGETISTSTIEMSDLEEDLKNSKTDIKPIQKATVNDVIDMVDWMETEFNEKYFINNKPATENSIVKDNDLIECRRTEGNKDDHY